MDQIFVCRTAYLLLHVLQAYPTENRSTDAQVRKFSSFFEFSISTSAYLRIGVYGDLADSVKVHQLERTFHGTAKPESHSIFDFQRMHSKRSLTYSRYSIQVFSRFLILPSLKRDLERKNSATRSMGSKFQSHFRTEADQHRVQQLLQVQKSGLGLVRTQKSSGKRACNLRFTQFSVEHVLQSTSTSIQYIDLHVPS